MKDSKQINIQEVFDKDKIKNFENILNKINDYQ